MPGHGPQPGACGWPFRLEMKSHYTELYCARPAAVCDGGFHQLSGTLTDGTSFVLFWRKGQGDG